MTKLKPFKVLKEEVVAEIGPHSFIKANLKAPNGKEVVWSYMQASDAVGILPLDQHHNVYLVKEWRAVRKDFVWSIPTGKVEESNPTEEDFENTANRELQEEAGVKARKLEKLGS